MSFNVYEDINFTMDVKCSKTAGADGEQRVERLVDIYDSVDKDQRVWTRDEGAHTQAVCRNHYRAAALVLGLLCLLLAVGLIVLSKLYNSISLENEMVNNRYEELRSKYQNLEKSYCKGQEGHLTKWKPYEDSCYYKSTEMKNWTESRRDCECRGADLIIINDYSEQAFVRELNKPEASWIGLVPERDDEGKRIWKWVDGTSLSYKAWRTTVKVVPENMTMSRAFIDAEGNWNQTTEGTKRWICEKKCPSGLFV